MEAVKSVNMCSFILPAGSRITPPVGSRHPTDGYSCWRVMIVSEEKIQWLRELIRKNDLHPFYGSAEWQALAARARLEQHNECQDCKERGYYSPCEAVHHIKPVRKYPELALSIDNLRCLCRNCHENAHKKKSFMNIERW